MITSSAMGAKPHWNHNSSHCNESVPGNSVGGVIARAVLQPGGSAATRRPPNLQPAFDRHHRNGSDTGKRQESLIEAVAQAFVGGTAPSTLRDDAKVGARTRHESWGAYERVRQAHGVDKLTPSAAELACTEIEGSMAAELHNTRQPSSASETATTQPIYRISRQCPFVRALRHFTPSASPCSLCPI
jgi:hypothetical protein